MRRDPLPPCRRCPLVVGIVLAVASRSRAELKPRARSSATLIAKLFIAATSEARSRLVTDWTALSHLVVAVAHMIERLLPLNCDLPHFLKRSRGSYRRLPLKTSEYTRS